MIPTPKVSVIVPVYNAEPYICQCVDSILSQSFMSFELILVDDGSSDKSGLICDEYARSDDRVCVLHKVNEGVSSARNAGIDMASGEYILFCDADDYLDSKILENAIRICETGIDICAFGYVRFDENGLLYESKIEEDLRVRTKDLTSKQLIELINKSYLLSPWSKLISRSLIAEKRFDRELSFGEDRVFILSLIENDCLFFASKDIGYYYRENAASLTLSISLNKCENAVTVYRYMLKFASDRSGTDSDLSDCIRKYWARDFYGLLHQIYNSKCDKNQKREMINSIMCDNELRQKAFALMTNKEKYESFVLILKSLYPNISVFLNRFIKRPRILR